MCFTDALTNAHTKEIETAGEHLKYLVVNFLRTVNSRKLQLQFEEGPIYRIGNINNKSCNSEGFV